MINKVRSKLGFTLLEVMIAMAVFAIAGTALLSSAEANFGHLERLEKETIASWVASNQLVNASLDTKTWPPKNNVSGKVEMAGHEWFWRQTVLATTQQTLRAVTVEVKLNEQDKTPLASMTTYLADERVQ